jgi:hypothetical protein
MTPGEEDSLGDKRSVAEDAEREIRRMSRRSFMGAGVSVLAGYGGWRWLTTRPDADGVRQPFRRALAFNERLSEAYFKPSRLAPTFPLSKAEMPRANGDDGLSDFDPDEWQLRVEGLGDKSRLTDHSGDAPAMILSLNDIKALPKVEMVTELKCIEGWSNVVNWGGARFLDFAAKYGPLTKSGQKANLKNRPEDVVDYVAMETPDGGYYVGLDRDSALHPQTLLCYEMDGKPLAFEHGAPLRLAIPVKYGIKSIKRIGTIRFTSQRPADFWAEQGYDWYAGH